MLRRAAFLLLAGLALYGCTNRKEPVPRIIDTPSTNNVIISSQTTTPRPEVERSTTDFPSSWLPPANLERRWSAIIIHHSGTDNGNAAIFDRWHREGRHWQGVGYDFVIGNGTDSGDGQVEVTFRWQDQLTGAHCKTPGNWANENAIGICLVGNFDKSRPTARQMQSLVKLVRFLMKRYGIPKSRIWGHRDVPGARVTDCPGRYFPMAKFKSLL